MKKILLNYFGKRYLFNLLFNKDDQTAIINSLYRRSEDDIDERMKYRCAQLAKKLMTL